MYLGIINGWERDHFRAVSGLGLKGVEFCINHDVDSAKVLEKKEQKDQLKLTAPTTGAKALETQEKTAFSRKLMWLSYMLWGGAVLLMFEHVWHGEVVAWFPFLAAMADPADTAEMLHEMATAGVLMAVLVTAVWAVMLVVTSAIEKRAAKSQLQTNES